MRCAYCSENPARFDRRQFPRIGSTYLVCRDCEKAQRRPSMLRTTGRGIRHAERERLQTALSIGAAKQKFKILVWGPTPKSDDAAAKKRIQVRDELRKMGHEAFFSEEMSVPAVPTNLVELVHQKMVHLVVNVAASHGSLAEFENFGILLGRRLLLFLNEAARGGFTDTGTRRVFRAAGGDDEFFADDDLKSCALTLAAVDWVRDKAHFEMYLAEVREATERNSLLR